MSTNQPNTSQDTMIDNTADVTQLALYSLCSVFLKLSQAQTVADVRAAVEPVRNLAENVVSQVEVNQIKLTFHHKGIDAVLQSLKERSTTTNTSTSSGD
jgi:hypothetical protein